MTPTRQAHPDTARRRPAQRPTARPLQRLLPGLLVVLACALSAAAAPAGCAKRVADLESAPARGDEATQALVALAVDYHKKADIALAEGQRDVAKQEMEDLLATTDRYDVRTVEGWDVRFDAATRLARMHLEDDELQQAETAVARGLEGANEAPPTLFKGYLLQTRADIEEKQGDPRAAVEAHSEAIEVFKGVLEAQRGGLPPREREVEP